MYISLLLFLHFVVFLFGNCIISPIFCVFIILMTLDFDRLGMPPVDAPPPAVLYVKNTKIIDKTKTAEHTKYVFDDFENDLKTSVTKKACRGLRFKIFDKGSFDDLIFTTTSSCRPQGPPCNVYAKGRRSTGVNQRMMCWIDLNMFFWGGMFVWKIQCFYSIHSIHSFFCLNFLYFFCIFWYILMWIWMEAFIAFIDNVNRGPIHMYQNHPDHPAVEPSVYICIDFSMQNKSKRTLHD